MEDGPPRLNPRTSHNEVRARETAVEKLDCAFLALTKAAEARERQQAR